MLADCVAATIERWGVSIVERAVFGTDDPATIAAAVDDWCAVHLGAPVAEGMCFETSVGCVAGVRLADGREVAVKVHQQRWTTSFLSAVAHVQRHLAIHGVPCPLPLAGPAPLGDALAVAETFLPDPGQAPIEPAMLGVSAAGLAQLVARCRDLDGAGLAGHPLDSAGGALYPEPHSPLFDFDATGPGAGWIDELAVAAKSARDRDSEDARPTIAHTDWSARNVRLGHDRVLAVYDWDSLALVAETTAVGNAAATWSAFGVDDDPVAPPAAEVAAHVSAYERARDEPFTADERARIGAAALWCLAYTARCEHAIDPTGERGAMRARPRLQDEGATLLSLADLMTR